MTSYKNFLLGTVAASAFAVLVAMPVPASAQLAGPAQIAIDNDDIGGVVTGRTVPRPAFG